MRGPHVFDGYLHDDAATDAAFTEGWFRTGDIGVIEDGYLRITGRKKDIIITSSGKNVTPSNIETALKESRWIAEAVVFGDNRPYLVALITLDPDEAPALAAKLGVAPDRAAMATDEAVRAAIGTVVEEANARFARIEQIKRFAILPHDLTQAGGELTPTLKVKRRVVYERYATSSTACMGEPAPAGSTRSGPPAGRSASRCATGRRWRSGRSARPTSSSCATASRGSAPSRATGASWSRCRG